MLKTDIIQDFLFADDCVKLPWTSLAPLYLHQLHNLWGEPDSHSTAEETGKEDPFKQPKLGGSHHFLSKLSLGFSMHELSSSAITAHKNCSPQPQVDWSGPDRFNGWTWCIRTQLRAWTRWNPIPLKPKQSLWRLCIHTIPRLLIWGPLSHKQCVCWFNSL